MTEACIENATETGRLKSMQVPGVKGCSHQPFQKENKPFYVAVSPNLLANMGRGSGVWVLEVWSDGVLVVLDAVGPQQRLKGLG